MPDSPLEVGLGVSLDEGVDGADTSMSLGEVRFEEVERMRELRRLSSLCDSGFSGQSLLEQRVGHR